MEDVLRGIPLAPPLAPPAMAVFGRGFGRGRAALARGEGGYSATVQDMSEHVQRADSGRPHQTLQGPAPRDSDNGRPKSTRPATCDPEQRGWFRHPATRRPRCSDAPTFELAKSFLF